MSGGTAAAPIGGRFARIQLEGLLDIRLRACRVAELEARRGPVGQALRVVGSELQGAIEFRKGFRVALQIGEQVAPIVEGCRVLRIQLEGPGILLKTPLGIEAGYARIPVEDPPQVMELGQGVVHLLGPVQKIQRRLM